MASLVNQISIGCAVNSAIIDDAIRKDGFIDSCINVPLRYGILPPGEGAPWPFHNASWQAYRLYCLIVVPKELYGLPEGDEFYGSLMAKDVFRSFKFIKRKEKKGNSEIFYYFNSLRNSISHVNYLIDSSGEYCFWDHPPGKSDCTYWHWQVKVKGSDMNIFLGEVAEAVFKIYNEVRAGLRNPDTYIKL